MGRLRSTWAVAALAALLAGACSTTNADLATGAKQSSGSPTTADAPTGVVPPAAPATTAGTTNPPATDAATTNAPPTTGPPATTRPATTEPAATAPPATVPAASGFTATTSKVTAADLPSSWRPGCPVGPDQLRMLHLAYIGFDGAAHQGTMVVNAAVADDVIAVFRQLYDARFPIRRMEPVDVYGGDDATSLAADNTAAFNCRYAVADGPPRWSVHALGEAIDVNPVENPYLEGGTVQPPAGTAYLDRSQYRAGMAVDGGELVGAFAAIGWGWGGTWSGTPDYQHFSATGG